VSTIDRREGLPEAGDGAVVISRFLPRIQTQQRYYYDHAEH